MKHPETSEQWGAGAMALALSVLVVTVVGLSLVGPATAIDGPVSDWSGGSSAGQSAVGVTGPVVADHGGSGPIARCEIPVIEEEDGVVYAALDASTSKNATLYRFDKYGTGAFDEYTELESREFTYEEPGTYEPRVQVLGENETTDTAVCGTISVGGDNTVPTAGFTYEPAEPTAGETVTFTVEGETSDPDGTVSDYSWRVNGEKVSIYPRFEYSFDGAGEYVVELTVTDDDGATDTVSKTVTVSDSDGNQPPTADFSVTPQEPTLRQETTFAAEASDPDGEVLEYSWQIDGQRVTGGSGFTVAFTEAGEHVVRLTVTDGDGATASASRTVTVTASGESQPPTVALSTPPSTPIPDESVSFTADASDPDGDVAGYVWRVDGEGVGEGPTLEYAFPGPGDYTVEVTVTDDAGATATASTTVTVEGAEPTDDEEVRVTAAWWHTPLRPQAGETVTLAADGAAGQGVSYRWDLDGDGESEKRGALVGHTFSATGERTVTLQAVGPDGTTETRTATVAVKGDSSGGGGSGGPALWMSPLDPLPGETVTLVAEGSAGSNVSYRWAFGDGTEKRGRVVSHVFTDSRTTVTLRRVAADGQVTTESATVTTRDAASIEPSGDRGPSLWVTPLRPQPGQPMTLVAEPAAPLSDVADYRWDFNGDGEPDARGRSVTHSVSVSGEFGVTLVLEYANGTTTTVEGSVTVAGNVTPEPTDSTDTPPTTTPPPEDPTDTANPGPDGDTGTAGIGTPGFGPVATLAALAATLLLGRRWSG